MCIICAKPSRVALPSDDIISRMFRNNPDGAGIMYTINGCVKIVKGLMTIADFYSALDHIKTEIDVLEEAMVLHFRIGTAGGNIPANTHPYPITDSLSQLQALRVVTNIGVAHNGIIPITPRRKDINDTMEYIMAQLAPLKRAVPKFYLNKHLMTLIKNGIASKMAFLTADRCIYTVGDFYEDGGLLYSNEGYKPYDYRNFRFSRTGGYGAYWTSGWYDDYDNDDQEWKVMDPKTGVVVSLSSSSGGHYRKMMWLEDSEYVIDEEGNFHDSSYETLMMDEKGKVYVYDYEEDEAIILGGEAWTENGIRLKYDPKRAQLEWVNPNRSYFEEINQAIEEDADFPSEEDPDQAEETAEAPFGADDEFTLEDDDSNDQLH